MKAERILEENDVDFVVLHLTISKPKKEYIDNIDLKFYSSGRGIHYMMELIVNYQEVINRQIVDRMFTMNKDDVIKSIQNIVKSYLDENKSIFTIHEDFENIMRLI